jgi:hypothetical protein
MTDQYIINVLFFIIETVCVYCTAQGGFTLLFHFKHEIRETPRSLYISELPEIRSILDSGLPKAYRHY